MTHHRHFGIVPRHDVDLPAGHPSLNRNGARVTLTDRTALPLSLAPRHDVDMSGDLLPSWFNEYPIPAADLQSEAGHIQPASPRRLPQDARRLVNAQARVIRLLIAAFALTFIACVTAVYLYDVAHRPVIHLTKGDRLAIAGGAR
jgi:hypothetical protein